MSGAVPRFRRVAALYDVHGNLPALDAVLADVADFGAEALVVGGDVTLGPMPREALGRLLAVDLPVHFVLGNCDVAVRCALDGSESGYRLPEQVMTNVRWVADRLADRDGDGDAARFAGWQPTVSLEVDGVGKVLFCHATPRSETEIFVEDTPDEALREAFAGVGEDLVVCGHTHMQFDRTLADSAVRVVNAGSVGMPFGAPGAYWLALGPEVSLRRTEYDFEAAARTIAATDYPEASRYAAEVAAPRPEDEMRRLFAGVARG